MKTNLLLLDSYNNIENLIHFSFSLTHRLNRKLKIVYVNDFDWMKRNYISGAGTTGISHASIIAAEKNANQEFEIAETKIREIVAEYIKRNKVRFPVVVNVSTLNRIELVKSELEDDKDLMVLLNNYKSYEENTGGSISYPNLIDHVNCPVFVIPKDRKHASLKNVVYASNFNSEDIRTLKNLSGILKNSENAHLTILHHRENFDFDEKLKWTGFKEIIQDEIDFDDISFTLKNQKDFVKSLQEFTENNEPDLLVLMKEKKGFFEDIFTTN